MLLLTTDMPTTYIDQIDQSSFVDYGMYVSSSEMFDASMQYTAFNDPNSANGDINNFQFEVYITPQ